MPSQWSNARSDKPCSGETRRLAQLPLNTLPFRLAIMSEYQKQTAFLKKLVLHEDTPSNRALCERLAAVERNERALRCASRLVGLIAMLGLAGLCYSAVLLPQFFDNSTHLVIRLCTALSFGSSLCFALFLGLQYSCRYSADRLHAECRVVISKMLAAKLTGFSESTSEPVIGDEPKVKIAVLRHPSEDPALEKPSLRQVS